MSKFVIEGAGYIVVRIHILRSRFSKSCSSLSGSSFEKLGLPTGAFWVSETEHPPNSTSTISRQFRFFEPLYNIRCSLSEVVVDVAFKRRQ
jgi:hypothetical protein